MNIRTTTLAATLAATLATTAVAQDCQQIGELAESIMKARQSGVAMREQYELVDGFALGEFLIQRAYEEPRFSTDRHQQRVTRDFGDTWFLACVQHTEGE